MENSSGSNVQKNVARRLELFGNQASTLRACPKGTVASFVIKNDDAQNAHVDAFLKETFDPSFGLSKTSAQKASETKIVALADTLKSSKKDYDDQNLFIGDSVTLYGGACNDESNGTTNEKAYPVDIWGISAGHLLGFLKVVRLGPCEQNTGKKDVRVCVVSASRSISGRP